MSAPRDLVRLVPTFLRFIRWLHCYYEHVRVRTYDTLDLSATNGAVHLAAGSTLLPVSLGDAANSQHRPPQPAIAALGANKHAVPTPNPATSAMERTKILTRIIIRLLNSVSIIPPKRRITIPQTRPLPM